MQTTDATTQAAEIPQRVETATLTSGGPRLRPMITRAHRHELQAERDRLRHQIEVEFADRLRSAREFGSPSENDEYLQIKEEEAVLSAGIAHLSQLLDSAIVLDETEQRVGVAAIGTTVEVEFLDSGQRRELHLIGGHEPLAPDVASAGSPIGRALMGKRAGDVVDVELPGRRQRTLKVVAVSPAGFRGST
jgi:transcription elongation factor GreA